MVVPALGSRVPVLGSELPDPEPCCDAAPDLPPGMPGTPGLETPPAPGAVVCAGWFWSLGCEVLVCARAGSAATVKATAAAVARSFFMRIPPMPMKGARWKRLLGASTLAPALGGNRVVENEVPDATGRRSGPCAVAAIGLRCALRWGKRSDR